MAHRLSAPRADCVLLRAFAIASRSLAPLGLTPLAEAMSGRPRFRGLQTGGVSRLFVSIREIRGLNHTGSPAA